ncbi:uncharacterized protein LOC105843567 [Hydra vulgaris]|uniref:uncharacterized protein LOC105843567 n=1 Tax=Hydra vulgaris TaxID=6087 RepID=UPI000640F770|nr:uncharacterized protein LOC105843567 [Hydra vulgaris]
MVSCIVAFAIFVTISAVNLAPLNQNEVGKTVDDFRKIFEKDFFFSRKKHKPATVTLNQHPIQIGRKDEFENNDNYYYNSVNKKMLMAGLYDKIRQATEDETFYTRLEERHAKKKEIVALLNEILKPGEDDAWL